MRLSVVIPAFNATETIRSILDELIQLGCFHEIIVVNDGSTDGTAAVVSRHYQAIKLISHPYNLGNGAAVKTGIRAASGD